MASINQDDVIQILKMVEESPYNELHLHEGDLKLVIKKGVTTTEPYRELESGIQEQVQSEGTEKAAVEANTVKFPLEESTHEEEEGFFAIKAPMLGTFYTSPKPGTPPFVKVGQLVTKEDTVCIIEVMKLFNTVKAGVRGRIVKVCADNSQMVEYQQTLFQVEEGEDGERT